MRRRTYVVRGSVWLRETRKKATGGERDRDHTPKIGSTDPGRGLDDYCTDLGYRRPAKKRWTKHIAMLCSVMMRRSENMPDNFSDVSRCLSALFASKNLPRFLPLGSPRQHPLYLTQLGVQKMRRKRCYPHALVSFLSSVIESYNFHIFSSRSS